MPTPPPSSPLPLPPQEPSPRNKTYSALLDFIRAMRTAPSSTPQEAMEWATLEQEFTFRTHATLSPTPKA